MTLLAAFAAVALVMTAVGLYWVISFSVSQSTRELGIRVALGARAGDALRTRHGDAGCCSRWWGWCWGSGQPGADPG
jgi:hypothetical protein